MDERQDFFLPRQERGRSRPARGFAAICAAIIVAATPRLAHAAPPDMTPDMTPDASQPPTDDSGAEQWAIHGQSTYTQQYQPAFRSPYQGPQSLPAAANGRETFDATLYAGFRPWKGAEIWINPEADQGFGLGNSFGVAGYLSGEAYKVGENDPYYRMSRAFFRQTIDLGGDTQKVDPGLNQLGGTQTANRLVLTAGKLSVVDIFDTNKYAHDPRNDFLNWSIVDAGSFDYAADAWGSTYGAAAEWYQDWWTVRVGLFDMSSTPNSTQLSLPLLHQDQFVTELEERHTLWGQPGKLKIPILAHPRQPRHLRGCAGFGRRDRHDAVHRRRSLLSQQVRRRAEPGTAVDPRSGVVRAGGLDPGRRGGGRLHRHRPDAVAWPVADRHALGPAERHGGIGRRGQSDFPRRQGISGGGRLGRDHR